MNLFEHIEEQSEAKPADHVADAQRARDSVPDVVAWRIVRAWKKLGVNLDARRIARQLSHPIFKQPTPLADAALAAAEAARSDPKTVAPQQCRYRCRICGSESITALSWQCRQDGSDCDLSTIDGAGFEIWD
jgi:hypothetical protein